MGISSNTLSPPPWKRSLLFVCALWLALLCPLAIAAFPAEYILFRPDAYLSALEESGFYHEAPGLMLNFAGVGGDLFVPGWGQTILDFLRVQNAETALSFVFPEAWVRAQTEMSVRSFFAYYNFETRELDLRLDFVPIKEHLSGGAARMLVSEMMAGWPDCSAQDILQIGLLTIKGQTDNLPRCRPPQLLENGMLNGLELGLGTFAKTLPDQVQLLPRQTGEAGGPYRTLRLGLRLAPFVVLLLGVAACALQGFSAARFWAWLGLPLYSGGLFAALSAAFLGWLSAWLLPMPAALLSGSAAALYQFFSAILLRVGARFLNWMALGGVIFALIGLGLYLLNSARVTQAISE